MSMLARLACLGRVSSAGIQYVGGASAGSASSSYSVALNALTGGIGSAPAQGDLIIVVSGFGTAGAARRNAGVSSSGYTEILDIFADYIYEATMSVSYKVADGSETSVSVLGVSSNTRGGATAVHVWRGVDPYIPLDVTTTSETGLNTVKPNAPSITPATTGSVIIACGLGAAIASNTTALITPSGMENGVNVVGVGTSSGCKASIASVAWTSGAYDPAAWTGGGTDSVDYAWCAATLALRPNQNITPPTFIASAQTQNATVGAALVINKPAGTQAGDLMVAAVAGGTSDTTTWTGDTGWTEVADLASKPNVRLAYKVAGSSEPASYTFTASSGANTNAGCILTYRNATYDTVGAFVTATTPAPAPGITVAANYSRLIGVFANGAVSVTCTTPPGMTARVTDNDATTPSYLVADEIVSLGATGTRTSDIGTISNGGAGILLAIKPA